MVQSNFSFLCVVNLLILNHVMVMGLFLEFEKCNLTAGAFVVYHMQHDNENKIGFILFCFGILVALVHSLSSHKYCRIIMISKQRMTYGVRFIFLVFLSETLNFLVLINSF